MKANFIVNLLEEQFVSEESYSDWEVWVQAKNNVKVLPHKRIFVGDLQSCFRFLESLKLKESQVSGVIVDSNAVKNRFFSLDDGKLIFADTPFPNTKWMLAKNFEPFR